MCNDKKCPYHNLCKNYSPEGQNNKWMGYCNLYDEIDLSKDSV